MVARTYQEGWNLRDKWEEALAEFPHFPAYFGDDGLPVLQVIAHQHRDGVRQTDVLALTPGAVHATWDQAVKATDAAVTFLVEHCGVSDPSWLPYPGILLTLAAVARQGINLKRHRKVLRQWFFSRTFGQRYEVASNTVTVEEAAYLFKALRRNKPLTPLRMSGDTLRGATRRRQGAMWRGVMCVFAADGLVDADGKTDPEELIPTSVLPRVQDPPRGNDSPHLLALGFILASRHVGRELKWSGVRQLREHLKGLSRARRDRLMKAQLLPTQLLTRTLSTERFVDARLKRLDDFLRQETGDRLSWDEDSNGS
jgi:hypothetical protein